MANKIHTITIGGKDRSLRYEIRNARDISRVLGQGKPIDALAIVDQDSLDGWAVLICHGLKHEDPKLIPDTVIDWFEQARQANRDIFFDLVLPAKRALGESGSLGRYFTYDDKGGLIVSAEGKGVAAGV